MWNWDMKSFSNETQTFFFFRMFWIFYILDLAKTVRAQQILSQKSTMNSGMKELEALENHVLVNMLLCSSHFTLSIHWYIAQNVYPTFSMFDLFRRSFKTAILSKFLKVAIARSNFVNKVYNGGLAPEISVAMLKETIALVWVYV